jgi:hypothetical protein
MLEYIFFNKKIAELFIIRANEFQIASSLQPNDACFTVTLSEDENEDKLELLEDYYDELFEMDRDLSEQESDDTNDLHSAGVTVQLKDGRYVYASVPPELLSKLMNSLSSNELNTLVCAISNAVESPDEKSLCQRHEENN